MIVPTFNMIQMKGAKKINYLLSMTGSLPLKTRMKIVYKDTVLLHILDKRKDERS